MTLIEYISIHGAGASLPNFRVQSRVADPDPSVRELFRSNCTFFVSVVLVGPGFVFWKEKIK